MNAPALSSWEEMTYRLVSLWDVVMDKFHADEFMERWAKIVSQHVADSNLRAYKATNYIKATDDAILRTNPDDINYQNIAALAELLERSGLDFSAQRARLMLKELSEGVHHSRYIDNIANLHGRILDEMKSVTFLVLHQKVRYLYEQDEPPFGADVHSKFTGRGNYEIEEASKCLALNRPTACAFHLLRACECGLLAIHKCLGIPHPKKDTDKSWGAFLKRIQEEIEKRDNLAHQSPWMKPDDRLVFQQMHDAAALIKNWRDPTMHLETKYTENEAEHLFALAKGFMQKVALRLDEDGLPRA